MNRAARCFLFFLLLPFSAEAQTNGPVPTAPFVENPAPGSQWSVEIAPLDTAGPGATNPPAGQPRFRTPVRLERIDAKDQVGVGTITYSDGTQEIYYVACGRILQKCTNSEKVALFGALSQRGQQDLRVIGFPGVEWVDAQNYTGTERVNNRDCLRFSMEPDFIAWIDKTDRLPVKVQKRGMVYIFSQVRPYDGVVNLPAPYLSVLNEYKRETGLKP